MKSKSSKPEFFEVWGGFVVAGGLFFLLLGIADAWVSSAWVIAAAVHSLLLVLAILLVLPFFVFGALRFEVSRRIAEFWKLRDKETDAKRAASLFSAGVSSGIGVVLLFVLNLHFSTAYNNKPLASFVFLILAGVAVFGLGFGVYPTLARVAEALFRRLRWGWWRFVVADLFVLLGAVAAIILARKNAYLFEIISPVPYLYLLGVLTAAGGIAFWADLRRSKSWTKLGALTFGIALACAAFTVPFAFDRLEHDVKERKAAFEQSWYMHVVLKLVKRSADRDKDGFSSIWGGGDCDDSNPNINPSATDIPGNGIDEDCSGSDAKPPPPPDVLRRQKLERLYRNVISKYQKKWNLLWITIDAVRADHVPYWGYERDTMPFLSALADKCVVFMQAHTIAPNTPQAIPSFFVGRYPSQIKWKRYHNFPPLTDEVVTLMMRLKQLGYTNAGIFSYWFFKKRNMERGADWWDNRAFRAGKPDGHSERDSSGEFVTAYAKEYLSKHWKGKTPLFLWLHYFDPHFLYIRHKGVKRYGRSQMDLYDHELRFTDGQVKDFLSYYNKLPISKDTVLFLTADHGEEFEEHGLKYHGGHVYEETVHVPLVVCIPGVEHKRIEKPVSLVDLVPTVLDLLGEDPSGGEYPVQGHSWLPLIFGGDEFYPDVVYIEKLKAPTFPYTLRSIIKWPYKLIHRVDDSVFELYDLSADPAEQRDLANSQPNLLKQMVELYNSWRAANLRFDGGWYKMAK